MDLMPLGRPIVAGLFLGEAGVMASELQRRKTELVFTAMDINSDGFLEREDFAALAERWTVNRGLAADTPEATRLSAIMMGWWETLLAASDTDRDGKVTLDEVLRVVDQLPYDTAPVMATAAALFEAIDADGDRRISAAEYRELIETWNGAPTDTDDVFGLLDRDGDGHVSKEDFIRLWIEFWAGDNPDAAGTWVFGRFEPPLSA
jgi:Ca2+-binding EF-hand superfamily protein